MDEIVLNTRTSYDQVAAEYAEKFKDEMDHKPFDRDCLDRLAGEVGTLGPIVISAADPVRSHAIYIAAVWIPWASTSRLA